MPNDRIKVICTVYSYTQWRKNENSTAFVEFQLPGFKMWMFWRKRRVWIMISDLCSLCGWIHPPDFPNNSALFKPLKWFHSYLQKSKPQNQTCCAERANKKSSIWEGTKPITSKSYMMYLTRWKCVINRWRLSKSALSLHNIIFLKVPQSRRAALQKERAQQLSTINSPTQFAPETSVASVLSVVNNFLRQERHKHFTN